MVSMNSLLNKTVLSLDAYDIGTITGFDLDITEWKVTHIGITLNSQSTKELGVRKPLLGGLTICIPVAHVDKVGDMVTLNLPFDHLKALPECKLL
jgi:sporulation protein YlmC with PRC-barrel domain